MLAVVIFNINLLFWDKKYLNISEYGYINCSVSRKFSYFFLNLKSNIPFFIGGIIAKLKVNIDRFVLIVIPQFGIDSYLTSVLGASCALLIDTTILLKWREQLKDNNFKYSINKIDRKIVIKIIYVFLFILIIYSILCLINRSFWQPLIFFPVVVGHCLNTFSIIYEETKLWTKNGISFFLIQTLMLVICTITVVCTILTKNPFFVSFSAGFCFIAILFISKFK